MQGGQWSQRLRRQHPLRGQHRQLTAPRGDHPPGHRDVVAEIDLGLPVRQGLRAHLGQRQHHLQPGAGVGQRQSFLQGGEAQLPGVADEHHPAGHRDHVLGLLPSLQIRPLGADIAQGMGARDGDGVGLASRGQQLGALLPAYPDLLGDVGLWRRRLIGHRPRLVEDSGPLSRVSRRSLPLRARSNPRGVQYSGTLHSAHARTLAQSRSPHSARARTLAEWVLARAPSRMDRGVRPLPGGNGRTDTLHAWRTFSRGISLERRSTR